jgi:hypothetical protein
MQSYIQANGQGLVIISKVIPYFNATNFIEIASLWPNSA